jgi:hypothetical protein
MVKGRLRIGPARQTSAKEKEHFPVSQGLVVRLIRLQSLLSVRMRRDHFLPVFPAFLTNDLLTNGNGMVALI